ncbi:MAG: hypothetical protein ACI4DY_13420 [Monoglobaceae bacterium]
MIKCDPRAKARCPFKNPCCGDETAYFVEGSECDEFNQIILAPPPTNADRIRAMSDEELAKMLYKTGRNYRAICADPVVDFREHYGDLLQWLKQPAEEG